MKNLSFLLALLLTVALLSHNSSAQVNNCGDALSRLYACKSGKCCTEVDDVVENCPRRLRGSFMRDYNRCNVKNPGTPPPPPPPSPPANSPPGFVCSPYVYPHGCNDEISDFWYKRSSRISSVCCNWVIEIQDNCPQISWSDFFIKPQQYCRNNHH